MPSREVARRLVGAAAALFFATVTAGCGGAPPPARARAAAIEPHWQDAVDTMPEILIVVRPRAIREDRVYGPLFKRAVQAARERSKVVEAVHPLETIEDAEEVVAGWRPDAQDHQGELLLVERGVRADFDPGKLVDDDGRPLWTTGPNGATRELVREQDEQGHPVDASLFELPGRTWVVATGPARVRARDAFAHPFQRPALELDPTALALVRIDGPSLVARVRALQDLGTFAAVGKHLKALTFTLPPGGEGAVRATFAYADEDAAAFSEVALRQVVGAVARTAAGGSPAATRLAWLARAKVERPDKRVVVTAPLPGSLIEGLLTAGSAPIDVDLPSPASSSPGPSH